MIAADLCINRESVRRILKKDLGLKSYKLQTSQQLSLRRLEFCSRIKRMVEQREIDIGTIIFSDKSHIYFRSFMNKQNFKKLSRTKPEEVYEKPLHSPKNGLQINSETKSSLIISNIGYKLNKFWQYVLSCGFYFIFLSLVVFEL